MRMIKKEVSRKTVENMMKIKKKKKKKKKKNTNIRYEKN